MYKKAKKLTALLLAALLTGLAACGSAPVPAQPESTGTDTEADAQTVITLADGGSAAAGEGVEIAGNTVTVKAAGTYALRGTLTNGQIVVCAGKRDEVRLVLDGVTVTSSGAAALYIQKAKRVTVAPAQGSGNVLTSTGAFAADGETTGCIHSKEDLVLGGSGALTVCSEQGGGVVCKDTLTVTGGQYAVTAGGHGLQANDGFVFVNGQMAVTSGKDGVHCQNKNDDSLGNVRMEGGSLTVCAGDDGVHAGNVLTVNGGSLTVSESREGLEGRQVNLNGGEISVKAYDDGVNAAGGADGSGAAADSGSGGAAAEINITGGTVAVNAQGDGVDANGALNVSGGTLYVSGPTNGGNGALDYDTAGTVTGGTVIAVGAAGRAVNFSGTSTQCSILVHITGGAGDTVSLKDTAGSTLAAFTPEKAFETAVISTPDLAVGQTYTVTAGENSVTLTLTAAVCTVFE